MTSSAFPAAPVRRRSGAAALARVLQWHLVGPVRSLGLRRLAASPDPWGKRLAVALGRAASCSLTPEEHAGAAPIEELRRRLCASSEVLVRQDFGAGEPDSAAGAAPAASGVERSETVGACTMRLSKQPFWCGVLLALVREARPVSALELGTAMGISAAYEGLGLQLKGAGSLVTLEGSATLARLAAGNLERLGIGTVEVRVGRFEETLPAVLRERAPVDFAFIDGHHQESATLSYFADIVPCLVPRALLVFDDISWSAGMRRAWRALSADRRVALAVDLGSVGLCVMGPQAGGRRYFRVPLNASAGRLRFEPGGDGPTSRG
jgi:predicted O-methyltransferase YrrM